MLAIKGLQKTTLLDYPGKLSCVVFLAGCNFRCPFCHNSDLVLRADKLPTISEEAFWDFLKSRKGKLEGVVVTGGEPTLQKELPEFMRKIKKLEFLVKLDTNGTNPKMVEELIKNKLIDYVALDYKGPFNKYYQYTKTVNDTERIKKTIERLVKSGLDFELRTTVVPTLHSQADLIQMAQEIPYLTKWYLQQFKPVNCLDPKFKRIKPYKTAILKDIFTELKKYHKNVELRGV